MKRLFYFGLLTLCSCVSSEHLVYNNDSFKKIETLKLNLNLEGYSIQRYKHQNIPDFSFSTTFLHARPENGNRTTTINLSVKTGINPKKLSSELFIVTDSDTIKTLGKDYFQNNYDVTTTTTTTTKDESNNNNSNTETKNVTNTSPIQLMQCTYPISDEEAKKIAYSKRIILRVYIGDVGIDIIPVMSQRDNITYFLKKTLVAPGYLGKSLR